MKKQLKTIGFAALSAFLAVSGATAAATGQSSISGDNLCQLIAKFQEIFKMIRTLVL